MNTEKNVVVLDVRTPQETAQGVIKGAVEINLYDPEFEQKIQQLDKSKTYLVYCRSGKRSVSACNVMAKNGFSKLYNLKGGYNSWSSNR
ncbi:MAG: rhodanese-like domain-containing protein [Saprospiraceae bacterium]|nr:rhodanese-like domain-containing protein [Saprospiraceae bacterium]